MTSDLAPEDPSAELLRRWQEDADPAALNKLLQIEVGVLKHMIHGRRITGLGGSASTSDVAQEAVLGLLKAKKPPSFAEPGALRGYLWTSAWHLLVKKLEKKREKPMSLDVEEPEDLDRFLRSVESLRDIERSERAMAIGLAMNVLSAKDREILRLVYFEQKDIAAAGAAIGLSRDVANTRLVRARRALAATLVDWGDLIG